MDLRQLNAFLTISKLQNFTAAANELGYAQSTVTTQIKLLEEELGVRLFERMGKSISLTYEGTKLIPYAKQMLKLDNDIRTAVFNEEKPSGTLVIGAAESLCVLRLPKILKEYKNLYPEVDISLTFGNCSTFRDMLKNNLIDIAFSLGRKIDSEDFIADTEIEEEMLLLSNTSNPLVHKDKIYPIDLKDQFFILTDKGCSYRAALETILKENNIKPKIALETSSVQAIKQFTISGLGITMLPKVAVKEELESGKLIKLNYCGPNLNIVSQVLYHKDKWISPAMKEFMILSKKYLGQ